MTSAAVSPPRRGLDPLLAVGAGLAAAAILAVLTHLAMRSLWWDELFSMSIASPTTPAAEAVTQIRSDVHPPLYFYGLRLWLGAFGTSDAFVARLFNLVPLSVAIGAAVWMLRRNPSSARVLWASLFFTAFGTLWYLQEARMYAAVIAQSFCATAVLVEFESRQRERLTPGYAVLTVLTFAVLPLCHWFSFAFGGMVLLGLAGWALLDRRFAFCGLFVATGLALGAAGGGWILANFQSTVGAADHYGGQIFDGALTLYGLRISATGALLFALTLNPLLIAACGLGVAGVLRSPRRDPGPLILAVVCVVLVALILGVSVHSPMYQARNFCWLVGPLTFFAALGLDWALSRLRASRATQALVLAGVVASNLIIARMAPRLYPLELDQWRQAGQYIAAVPGCAKAPIEATAQWLHKPIGPLGFAYSRRMYGYYAGAPDRIQLVVPGDTIKPDPAAACPVALWVAQLPDDQAIALGRQLLGPAFSQMDEVTFRGHMIFVRKTSAHPRIAAN